MAEREYIRLARPRPKSGFQFAVTERTSLWLGKDHLLCVDTSGYTETYKRFYFRDIQAITVRRTRRHVVWGIVLSLPILFCAVVFTVGAVDMSGRPLESGDYWGILWWSLALAVFSVPFVINLLRGPGCVCRIRTAVQEEEISCVKRVKMLQKILARIRPLIAEAQGLVTPEEIPTRMQELAAQEEPRLVVDDPNLPPRMVV